MVVRRTHQLASSVRAGRGTEAELDRFCELAVAWVLHNPRPHPLGDVTYTW